MLPARRGMDEREMGESGQRRTLAAARAHAESSASAQGVARCGQRQERNRGERSEDGGARGL